MMMECKGLKRVLLLVLGAACFWGTATAEPARYSIRNLGSETASSWQQTYQAHGRTIEVNVPIEIPAVDAAPVLLVQSVEPVPEPMYSEWKAKCEWAEKDDPVNAYSFLSTDFRTGLVHARPPAWGETRDSLFIEGAMGQKSYDLISYDESVAYAQDNPLTIAEATEIAKRQAATFFPNDVLDLRNITVHDRSYWKDNNEPISEKGHYALRFTQTFHGIPFMASIHSTYSRMAVGNEEPWLMFRGQMNASVYDADAWSFSCCFYQETDILFDDIPLVPFDSVKQQMEALILSGHVRRIDEVALGYVQFDTDDPAQQVLVPAWVVWCEYHKDGAQSERTASANRNQALLYEDREYYRPIIFNAQLGEMIHPETTAEGRCLCPAIIPW